MLQSNAFIYSLSSTGDKPVMLMGDRTSLFPSFWQTVQRSGAIVSTTLMSLVLFATPLQAQTTIPDSLSSYSPASTRIPQRFGVQLPALPELPPADHFLPDTELVATHLVLRLGERRVFVYADDEVMASYPVAIGTPATPTPTGEFEIFQMVENPVWQSPWTGEVHEPGPNSALGLRWIGFAQMSNGIIGFHGTPTVSSIGRAASNGCVRLRNEDVLELFDHAEMGMVVVVEP